MGEDFISRSRGVAAQLQAFDVPALRKHREGRGTHFVGDDRRDQKPGPPATLGKRV